MESNGQGGPGSVRFGYGLGVEGFERFRFSVLAVPLLKVFFCVSVQFNREGRFRFRFRFLENGSCGSGSNFGFGKNGSDGSGFRLRFGSWAILNGGAIVCDTTENTVRQGSCDRCLGIGVGGNRLGR